MLAVNGFNPTIVLPTHDDVSQPAIRSTLLQGAKVVTSERWSQLIKDAVVGAVTLTLILRTYILILKGFTKESHLTLQTIVCHQ
jgi:hypothetical protein